MATQSKQSSGPRATPCVADGKLYTFGVTGILSCFDAASGDDVWRVDTLKEFKAPNLQFGISSSPLVDGPNVLVSSRKPDDLPSFNAELVNAFANAPALAK